MEAKTKVIFPEKSNIKTTYETFEQKKTKKIPAIIFPNNLQIIGYRRCIIIPDSYLDNTNYEKFVKESKTNNCNKKFPIIFIPSKVNYTFDTSNYIKCISDEEFIEKYSYFNLIKGKIIWKLYSKKIKNEIKI